MRAESRHDVLDPREALRNIDLSVAGFNKCN